MKNLRGLVDVDIVRPFPCGCKRSDTGLELEEAQVDGFEHLPMAQIVGMARIGHQLTLPPAPAIPHGFKPI